MAKKIALTGGIGSGKTTLANYFASLGFPVFIADDAAKEIMKTPAIIAEIVKTFGKEVYKKEKLLRAELAKIVFSNPKKLQLLNAIVHPAVQQAFDQWLAKNASFPFVIYESAIVFESGNYKNFDVIICADAPEETRIERVIKRDKTTRDAVLKRMKMQWTQEQRAEKSTFVVATTNLAAAKKSVDNIVKILMI